MSTFPARWDSAQQKPAPVDEAANKAAAKLRDGYRCQRPYCPHCGNAPYGGGYLLHGCHVFAGAKGIGGDPLGIRSERRHFVTLCGPSHAEQERHELEFVALDQDLLGDGDFEVYGVSNGTREYEGTVIR